MTGMRRRGGPGGRRWVVVPPYAWLSVFLLVPLAIVIGISLATSRVGVPPYTPLVAWLEGARAQVTLDFGNYAQLIADDLFLAAYLGSLKTAAIATVGCLALGYPIAYGMARTPQGRQRLMLMLVVLPFWTSFLIRVYAWIGLLQDTGLINTVLIQLGLIDEPLQLMATPFAVQIGIIYTYLPFMILPLYATLEKLDPSLLEAAADLGCRPLRAFLSVTLPLSMPGVAAGAMLVFIPAVGEYVIPELLGGPDTLMIGSVLWTEFFSNRDWPVASAIAIAMLVALVLPLMLFQRQLAGTTRGRR